MSKSPQIQSRINTIAKELANGKDRGYILGKYGKKWEISRTSIDRLIEKSKPIATDISKRAEKTISDTREAELKEAAKIGLKSVIEIDLKLQGIIFKAKNSPADQIRAIDIYYKRHGHYDKDNDQKIPTSAQITDSQFQTLLQTARETKTNSGK